MKFNPDWVWAAGDYVVAGITTKGTNNGALPGGIEASGEPFETHQVDVYQLRDGKIGKQWLFTNGYAFAVQLGFLPDPTEGDEGDEDE
jgi:ketosteroid isomerase-like protein